MKKITLLAALFAAFSMNAQLFSDDFEDQDISDWTLLDEDGDGYNFMAMTPVLPRMVKKILCHQNHGLGLPCFQITTLYLLQ